jgi:hypothetical protein
MLREVLEEMVVFLIHERTMEAKYQMEALVEKVETSTSEQVLVCKIFTSLGELISKETMASLAKVRKMMGLTAKMSIIQFH